MKNYNLDKFNTKESMNKSSNNKFDLDKEYTLKAKKCIYISIGIFIFSFCTYIFFLTGKYKYFSFSNYTNVENSLFDFGLIIEILSFISLITSLFFINKGKKDYAKRFLIISMFCLASLIAYDVVSLILNIDDITIFSIGFTGYSVVTYIRSFSLDLILNILYMASSYKSLAKSEGNTDYNSSTDWFYEK